MNRLSFKITLAFFLIGSVFAAAQQREDSSILRISFPGATWDLQISAPGFSVMQDLTQPDGRRYLYATQESSGSGVSVTLERTGRTATLDACREGLRQKSAPGGPFELTAVKQSQIGEMAVMEYIVPQALNAPVNQKSLFGCMVKDDVFADIHVSKTKFKTADQSFLLGILTSAHFAARQPGETRNLAPAESSLALVAEGSRYFLQNQFDKAIGPYQRALDLEKQSRQLESVQWRVLIDNLAMAYGISGKLDESETTLKYGLTQDPTYPMFYFILADNFGERKDLANTMKNLRLALQYKANMIPGEALPDPAKDDSFKAFWQNAEFKKLAGEFK